jgi:ankyrin repeat protein
MMEGRIDASLHLLDKVAALGDVELFNKLVSLGADPLKSEALHRASKCHDEAKSIAMVSCLIDRHRMSLKAELHAGYCDVFDRGAENGTPLCSAIYNRNMPVVAELVRRSKSEDLWSSISTAVGGPRIQYNEPALLLLLDLGGVDSQKVLYEAILRDNFRAATISLEHGADASFALREQIEARDLALAQNLNPPECYADMIGYREMSEGMKVFLEGWADKVTKASSEASRL